MGRDVPKATMDEDGGGRREGEKTDNINKNEIRRRGMNQTIKKEYRKKKMKTEKEKLKK